MPAGAASQHHSACKRKLKHSHKTESKACYDEISSMRQTGAAMMGQPKMLREANMQAQAACYVKGRALKAMQKVNARSMAPTGLYLAPSCCCCINDYHAACRVMHAGHLGRLGADHPTNALPTSWCACKQQCQLLTHARLICIAESCADQYCNCILPQLMMKPVCIPFITINARMCARSMLRAGLCQLLVQVYRQAGKPLLYQ